MARGLDGQSKTKVQFSGFEEGENERIRLFSSLAAH